MLDEDKIASGLLNSYKTYQKFLPFNLEGDCGQMINKSHISYFTNHINEAYYIKTAEDWTIVTYLLELLSQKDVVRVIDIMSQKRDGMEISKIQRLFGHTSEIIYKLIDAEIIKQDKDIIIPGINFDKTLICLEILRTLLPIIEEEQEQKLNKQAKIDINHLDLIGANLRGANLSGANLANHDLKDADLRGANLSRTDLSGANLSEANLTEIVLTEVNLNGVDLSYADLRGANLSRTDLSGANLKDADLSDATMIETDLSGANLKDADLSYVNLFGSRLDDVRLEDTKKIFGSNIEGIKQPQHPSLDNMFLTQKPKNDYYVVKMNGRRQKFNNRKLIRSILNANVKEPVAIDIVESVGKRVVVLPHSDKLIKSADIRAMVKQELEEKGLEYNAKLYTNFIKNGSSCTRSNLNVNP